MKIVSSMMVNEADFNDLTLRQKIRHLYMEGTFLMDIRYYEYKINLYILNNFYVEVFYHHKKDKIEKIEVMDKDHSRMKFYADRIRLSDL